MGLFNRSTDTLEATSAAIADIAGDYTLDAAHTRIGFVARHAMVTKVRGQFADFEGSAHIDTANPAGSSVKVVIKAASVSTGNEQRDGHIVTPDFFDVETYPEITFVSTKVERDGAEWGITGDLTINAVTKPVTIEFEETGSVIDPWGNTRIGFEGETTISRSEWGLSWNAALEAGGVLVSEKVKLEFDVSAVAQVPSQA
ncbi:MAG: YceI family protein [Intrasporangium sp.]|uniref:YceI family protein n=1 Tax=Intrasporangium sp. TaxID=1925024 RepID=UPI002648A9C4|nr:YceI family protein [Intrasporangium sp.]MDN5795346.1 YceI family protein [Intrasporangium sp.]